MGEVFASKFVPISYHVSPCGETPILVQAPELFLSVPKPSILLWLTQDDFTRQGEYSPTGKG